ncbi:hypothetical protein [Parvularcula maris]|uniref:Uncharacterized protein n=1 Tax=Parvularcula maris TaxID=2965077 RepID=A0A9X2L8P0_9PROT|nr:hypothetical protein [Parvularcula maris]MCQ8185138.1 hypothetical protein [Parvularcula maris]
MQFLGLLVTILVGISVWYWRIRMLKNLGDNVIDATSRFQGARRRKKIASATESSPVEAIADPVTAAATLIRLLVGEETWPTAQGRVQVRLAELSSFPLAKEAVTYADWAGKQPVERRRAVESLTARLRDWLTLEERQDLVALVADAASSGTASIQAKASREALALIN